MLEPSVVAALQLEDPVALSTKGAGRDGVAPPGLAIRDDRGVLRQLVQVPEHLAGAEVLRLGDMAVCVLRGVANIEQHIRLDCGELLRGDGCRDEPRKALETADVTGMVINPDSDQVGPQSVRLILVGGSSTKGRLSRSGS